MKGTPLEHLDELPTELPARRARLRDLLVRRFEEGAGRSWSEEEFDRMATAIFRYQVDANEVYGALVRKRGLNPLSVDRWQDIPFIPTRAFKEMPLISSAAGPVEATFLTSGTTVGRRGIHRVCDLSLYRASALSAAEHFLLEDQEEGREGFKRTRIRILSLTPSPVDRPDSSLVHMVDFLREAWDDGGGGFFAEGDWSPRAEAFITALGRASAEAVPTLVLGTAFSLLAWLNQNIGSITTALPAGSILVETGGFKGRSRTVSRSELYRGLVEAFGIPQGRIVNEYGMTEMLSQFYEPVLREGGPEDPAIRVHQGPPWVRTRVLDPHSLEPLPAGERGLLSHVDLANLDSVSAILTEDVGTSTGDAFRLHGRSGGAEPRGCSLAMEELLESRRWGGP